MTSVQIDPMGAVRQTRRDKFNPSPAVRRYRSYRDVVRLHVRAIPECVCFVFIIAMPKSWSQKKRDLMRGKPHQQTPDIDNLVKGVMDAVLKSDGHIHQITTAKFWGDHGRIVVCESQMWNWAI